VRGFYAVLRKEAVQMIRDKGTLRLVLMIPAFQLVLFGLIDTNVKHVRSVVVDFSRTSERASSSSRRRDSFSRLTLATVRFFSTTRGIVKR